MLCPSELQLFRKIGSKVIWSPLDVVTAVGYSHIRFSGIRGIEAYSRRARPHPWANHGSVSLWTARASFRSEAVLRTFPGNDDTAIELRHSTAGTNAARDADSGNMPHQPVLLREILSAFADNSVANFLDGTLGAGGHSSAVGHDEQGKSGLYY